ncbi:hypothetical protein KOW79_015087, partial [Hemibagrus wyckioides]
RDLFVLLSSVAPSASVIAPDPESLPPSPISCSGSDPTSSMPSENSIEAQSGRTRVEASATPSVASAQLPNSPASSPRPGHELGGNTGWGYLARCQRLSRGQAHLLKARLRSAT